MDGRFLLHQFFEIKKKENETIHAFNIYFDKIVSNILDDIRLEDQAILIHYLNSFDGWMGLVIAYFVARATMMH